MPAKVSIRQIPDDLSLADVAVALVDDNRNFLHIMRSILWSFGVRTILETTSPYDVLEHLRGHDVDLLFVDKVMPGVDGLELTRMIRSDRTLATRDLPIVCVTAHSEYRHVLAAIQAGADGFLVKPVTPADVYRQLVQQISNPLPRIKVNGYFGPDRRRNFRNTHSGPERRGEVDWLTKHPKQVDGADSEKAFVSRVNST